MLVADNSNSYLCVDGDDYYYINAPIKLYTVTIKNENSVVVPNETFYLNRCIQISTNTNGIATFYSSYDSPPKFLSKTITSKAVDISSESNTFTTNILCNSTVTMEVGIYCIGTIHWSDGTTTVKNRWEDGNSGSSSRFVTVTKPVGITFTVSAEYNRNYEGQIDVDDYYNVSSDKVFTLTKETYSINIIEVYDDVEGN